MEILEFSLLTAHRVLLKIKKDLRAEVLRHWKSYLSQGGKLVVDVPHPGRVLSAIVIGYRREPGPSQLSHDSRPVWTMCCRLADDRVWEECRSYARDLARDAGLMITNDMPEALPRCEINQDGRPAFQSWLARSRATTLIMRPKTRNVNGITITGTSMICWACKTLRPVSTPTKPLFSDSRCKDVRS